MATSVAAIRFVMLANARTIDTRSDVAAGPLAPLARSLAADLDRLLPDEDVFVPPEKAKMTRAGGRCQRDGAPLDFDPARPRQHRCPVCGSVYEGEEHYRWWIMGYQLWLAERAVHASALWRLLGMARHQRLAETILGRLADRYVSWPNEDNVLGPARVFFSTYLESIWALQLAVAVSLLERAGTSPVGALVRDRILTPSSALVASFDEGLSNRQVWNSAALGAAGVLLDRPQMLDRALFGSGGLEDFLRNGLLEDGSWYEGENYHLFAHRGLWYLSMLAEHAGAALPAQLTARFQLGFAAPLKTALPDFTFPARRDSQYRASLRQWRMAESLELGLARAPGSVELAAGLAVLYGDAPSGDTARWRSTAEAERNVPGVRLTRRDLGWKSLLFALPQIPAADREPPGSALMPGQGFAVIRRERGRVYAALDYGHGGGSHGHPDRLNLWLVIGDQRVFEDVGTGSYVDRALYWYRSTLAHNAPLINGRSQGPATGTLRAWDEHGDHAWIDTEAAVANGVLVRRTVVVSPGHLVDRLEWTADREVTLDLPMHIDAELAGARWQSGVLSGGSGLEDGFDFLADPETTPSLAMPYDISASGISGSVHDDAPHVWWRAFGPGAPGQPSRRFLLLRSVGQRGCITSAWSWQGSVELRRAGDEPLVVTAAGGVFNHWPSGDSWRVLGPDGVGLVLGGRRSHSPASEAASAPRTRIRWVIPAVRRPGIAVGELTASGGGLRVELGEAHYRRTEATWKDAGSPTATVVLGASESELLIEVSVVAREPDFVAEQTDNPLDNEHPDINSDGVQLHFIRDASDGVRRAASWLLVPEPGSARVRTSCRDGASSIPLDSSWRRTPTGWQLLCRLDRAAVGVADAPFGLDVIVNEKPRWRERRRGQLVLSGGGGWAYLRGDRQDAERLIPMVIQDA